MLWLVIAATILVLIYLKFVKPLNYWKSKGVLYEKPWPVLGNMSSTIFRKQSFLERALDTYKAFPEARYHGVYQFMRPALVVRDVALIKKILIKDFDHFTDHNPLTTEELEPLIGKNLLFLKGQRWRDTRATLSPAFTGNKMRIMFQALCEAADQFVQYFEKQSSKEIISIEMKDAFTRFTNNTTASIAFGLKVDSLQERDNEFYLMGREAMNFGGWRALKFFVFNLSPTLSKLLKFKFLPSCVRSFFRRLVKETVQHREWKGLGRFDIVHLLMEAKNKQLKKDENNTNVLENIERQQKLKLTDEDVTALALGFFFAGFETEAAVMSFIAYELAVNPDVQKKLHTEIVDNLIKCHGKITYEAIRKMKYLDMVISETMRKWPPGFQLDRICVKDYTIEPERPSEKSLTLEKGQLVLIPVIGVHFDPEIYPNPDKFDPERFNKENRSNIQPATYMPFGAGPRNCIASRFALLELKTLFFYFLLTFELVVVEKTPIPLRVGKLSFNIAPDEGFWLGLKKRKIRQD